LRDYPFKPCDEKDFSASIKKLRTASILSTNENRISVYPNPTYSNLKIEGVESGSYMILNSLGQNVLSGLFTKDIMTESLKPGYYSIIILNNSSKVEYKFIKN
jgi:hypothetical protein